MNFKIFAYLMMWSMLSFGSNIGDGIDSCDDFDSETWEAFCGISPSLGETATTSRLKTLITASSSSLPSDVILDAFVNAEHVLLDETIDGDEIHDAGYGLDNLKKRLRPKPEKEVQSAPSPSIEDLATDMYSGPVLRTLDELIDHFGPGPNLKQEPGRPRGGRNWAIPNFVKQVYAAAGGNKRLTRHYFGDIHQDTLMNVIDPDFRQQRNNQQKINKRRRNGK